MESNIDHEKIVLPSSNVNQEKKDSPTIESINVNPDKKVSRTIQSI